MPFSEPQQSSPAEELTDGRRRPPGDLSWLDPVCDHLVDRRWPERDTAETEALIRAVFPDYSPASTMFDMDGVLTVQPTSNETPPEDTVEGDAWWDHLHDARPFFLPSGPVLAVASGRLECYRTLTTFWLHRYEVSFILLHLSTYATAAARDIGPPAEEKTRKYMQSPASLFIESDEVQALAIVGQSRRPVFCMETMTVFRGQ